MISVNQLTQMACELCSLVEAGESVRNGSEGDMSVVCLNLLNSMIADLNAKDYISMQNATIDVPCNRITWFVEGGDPERNAINMMPPETINDVARSFGNRFIPLQHGDPLTISMQNCIGIPHNWTYSRELEDYEIEGVTRQRLVGKLELDGRASGTIRIFYNKPLPTYTLQDTIYLSDLYNNMLLQGLCYNLCIYYKLADYKQAFEIEFDKAKAAIKKKNYNSRMMQRDGGRFGDYRDLYAAALAPNAMF